MELRLGVSEGWGFVGWSGGQLSAAGVDRGLECWFGCVVVVVRVCGWADGVTGYGVAVARVVVVRRMVAVIVCMMMAGFIRFFRI